MAEHKTFRCHIDTPDGRALAGVYVSLTAPALDGYIGVLAGRAPLTAVVTTGQITLVPPQGAPEELFVSRGFLQVHEDTVSILAEECKPIRELDAERAWDLLQQAYKLPRETDEQIAYRDEMIRAERIRFGLAQKARKGMMSMEQMLTRGLT
ncbi:MAG: F0F1 ATP synthase subunit epsilon [Phycisphaerae bacterium]|nr:F0F1 ATP synthase subunit epsilon [Phycisphaerae bacterium]